MAYRVGSVIQQPIKSYGEVTAEAEDQQLQKQDRELRALTLQEAVEQRRAKAAEAQAQRELEGVWNETVKRHVNPETGKPDFDSAISELYKVHPGLAQAKDQELQKYRSSITDARIKDLQKSKIEGDMGLDALNRLNEANFSIMLPRIQALDPDLAQAIGPTYNPRVIESLKTGGTDKARRVEELALLYGKDPRQGVLAELLTAETPQDIKETWGGVEHYYGPTVTAQLQAQVGDVSTPEGKARLQQLMAGQQKPETAPNVGSFEDYVTRKHGPNPTAQQVATARQEYARAGHVEGQGATSPVSVIGPDGKPVYVRPSDAIGKTPASTREQGRPVTSGDTHRITDINASLMQAATLRTELEGVKDATGIRASATAALPAFVTSLTGWGVDAKKKDALIGLVRQIIGKGLEGGVLRKEDEYKYAKILPVISDTPAVVTSKIDGLEKALKDKRDVELDSLEDAGYDVSKYRQRLATGGPSASTLPKGRTFKAEQDGVVYEITTDAAGKIVSQKVVK